MEYKLIMVDTYGGDFQKQVNEHIENGWKPQGGVSVSKQDRITFCQAMVKEK